MTNISIQHIAILGAGVMGAQIAALFANAQFQVDLFDLEDYSQKALKNLLKINPAPLGSPKQLHLISPKNYDQHLNELQKADLIIEVIAEKLEYKKSLYEKITPVISEHTIIASNTSGISITKLSECLPEKLRARFLGIHFFNPPRYLPLVELIPHAHTDTHILDALETFLTTYLGKKIIRAKDAPNFLANRLGAFALAAAIHHADALNIPFEVVDQLTGKRLNRPKSATFRTADVVGLDTLAHVFQNVHKNAPEDPWHTYYKLPTWMSQLIESGALGQKTKKGIFQKIKGQIHAIDRQTGQYHPADKKADKTVLELLKIKNQKEKFKALAQSDHPEAQFLFRTFKDCFAYGLFHAENICHNLQDADFALRWGFGWSEGLFELIEMIGLHTVQSWLDPKYLPTWFVGLPSNSELTPLYNTDSNGKPYNFDTKTHAFPKKLPIYEKQIFPDTNHFQNKTRGITLTENDSIRLWHQEDQILLVSFKSKMGTIGSEVLAGLCDAVTLAESQNYKGIIIHHPGEDHFSAGANLEEFGMAFMLDGPSAIGDILENFQNTMLKLRYAKVPVVAITHGYVFGGGCELMLHCDHTVAAFESYIGLVEVGVGIIPGGGGCKEMALRAYNNTISPEKQMQPYLENIAKAEVAKSALQAKEMGYLRPQDHIVFHPNECLIVAKSVIENLHLSNYLPPIPPQIPAFGPDAAATINMLLVNMEGGHFISSYDREIALAIADVMTGGGLDKGELAPESWYLALERKHFVRLIEQDKTQARIEHMLKTGKPLRN